MKTADNAFIAADELIRKTGGTLIRNTGKAIAIITAVIAVLLTFTDVSFGSLISKELTGNIVMMLISAYLIYFSLEDAGEKLGEESEEYIDANERYGKARSAVRAEDMSALREYCIMYSERELEYRRRSELVGAGLSTEEYSRWREGEPVSKRSQRIYRRINRMKAVCLTPSSLLSHNQRHQKSELRDPGRFKPIRMAAKLIPTTVCMCVTVSVMLTMKDGLSPEAVIEGLIKLATLPIVAFRGYAAGYGYIKESMIPWIQTKTRLLESFKKET